MPTKLKMEIGRGELQSGSEFKQNPVVISATSRLVPNVRSKCSICNKAYVTPRLLACLHAFCESCIDELLVRNSYRDASKAADERSLACPKCKHVTTVGMEGAASLPYDHILTKMLEMATSQKPTLCRLGCKTKGKAVARCLDCAHLFCPKCKVAHEDIGSFKHHRVISLQEWKNPGRSATLPKPIICDSHSSQVPGSFCHTCQKLICKECKQTLHKAPKHKYSGIADSLEKSKNDIASLLTQSKMEAVSCQKTATKLENSVGSLERMRDSAKYVLEETYEIYKAVLEQVKNEALLELTSIHKKQEADLKDNLYNVDKSMEQLDRVNEFATVLLEKGGALEILSLKPAVLSHLKYLISSVRKPEVNIALEFVTNMNQFKSAVKSAFGFFKHPDHKREGKAPPTTTAPQHSSVPSAVVQPFSFGSKIDFLTSVSPPNLTLDLAPSQEFNLMQLATLAAGTEKLPSPTEGDDTATTIPQSIVINDVMSENLPISMDTTPVVMLSPFKNEINASTSTSPPTVTLGVVSSEDCKLKPPEIDASEEKSPLQPNFPQHTEFILPELEVSDDITANGNVSGPSSPVTTISSDDIEVKFSTFVASSEKHNATPVRSPSPRTTSPQRHKTTTRQQPVTTDILVNGNVAAATSPAPSSPTKRISSADRTDRLTPVPSPTSPRASTNYDLTPPKKHVASTRQSRSPLASSPQRNRASAARQQLVLDEATIKANAITSSPVVLLSPIDSEINFSTSLTSPSSKSSPSRKERNVTPPVSPLRRTSSRSPKKAPAAVQSPVTNDILEDENVSVPSSLDTMPSSPDSKVEVSTSLTSPSSKSSLARKERNVTPPVSPLRWTSSRSPKKAPAALQSPVINDILEDENVSVPSSLDLMPSSPDSKVEVLTSVPSPTSPVDQDLSSDSDTHDVILIFSSSESQSPSELDWITGDEGDESGIEAELDDEQLKTVMSRMIFGETYDGAASCSAINSALDNASDTEKETDLEKPVPEPMENRKEGTVARRTVTVTMKRRENVEENEVKLTQRSPSPFKSRFKRQRSDSESSCEVEPNKQQLEDKVVKKDRKHYICLWNGGDASSSPVKQDTNELQDEVIEQDINHRLFIQDGYSAPSSPVVTEDENQEKETVVEQEDEHNSLQDGDGLTSSLDVKQDKNHQGDDFVEQDSDSPASSNNVEQEKNQEQDEVVEQVKIPKSRLQDGDSAISSPNVKDDRKHISHLQDSTSSSRDAKRDNRFKSHLQSDDSATSSRDVKRLGDKVVEQDKKRKSRSQGSDSPASSHDVNQDENQKQDKVVEQDKKHKSRSQDGDSATSSSDVKRDKNHKSHFWDDDSATCSRDVKQGKNQEQDKVVEQDIKRKSRLRDSDSPASSHDVKRDQNQEQDKVVEQLKKHKSRLQDGDRATSPDVKHDKKHKSHLRDSVTSSSPDVKHDKKHKSHLQSGESATSSRDVKQSKNQQVDTVVEQDKKRTSRSQDRVSATSSHDVKQDKNLQQDKDVEQDKKHKLRLRDSGSTPSSRDVKQDKKHNSHLRDDDSATSHRDGKQGKNQQEDKVAEQEQKRKSRLRDSNIATDSHDVRQNKNRERDKVVEQDEKHKSRSQDRDSATSSSDAKRDMKHKSRLRDGDSATCSRNIKGGKNEQEEKVVEQDKKRKSHLENGDVTRSSDVKQDVKHKSSLRDGDSATSSRDAKQDKKHKARHRDSSRDVKQDKKLKARLRDGDRATSSRNVKENKKRDEEQDKVAEQDQNGNEHSLDSDSDISSDEDFSDTNHDRIRHNKRKRPRDDKNLSESAKKKKRGRKPWKCNSTEKPFICPHCGKGFPINSRLTKHMVMHSADRPFACSECPARFKRRHTLTLHKLCHSSDKPFPCSKCPAQFKCSRDLKMHEIIHSNLSPFKCKICGSRFKEAKRLRRHYLTHSDDRPFKCDICSTGFKYAYVLKLHQQARHSDEKRFVCAICDAAFKTRPCLKSHMLLHAAKQYQCKVCEKVFRHKNYLQIHLKKVCKFGLKKRKQSAKNAS